MYRRRRELEIREQHNYSEITDIQLDAVIQSSSKLAQLWAGDDERCSSWAGIENSKKENKGVNVAGRPSWCRVQTAFANKERSS